MIKEFVTHAPIAALSFLLLAACQGDGDDSQPAPAAQAAPGTDATTETPLTLEFPNAKQEIPGVWGGGQPTREQLRAAAEAGVRTVVNLRTLGEEGAWDETAFVEELGMRFVHIPVAGPSGITAENAALLAAITGDEATHPLMVHCASGRRVSALIALGPTD